MVAGPAVAYSKRESRQCDRLAIFVAGEFQTLISKL